LIHWGELLMEALFDARQSSVKPVYPNALLGRRHLNMRKARLDMGPMRRVRPSSRFSIRSIAARRCEATLAQREFRSCWRLHCQSTSPSQYAFDIGANVLNSLG
jgi:hypothetical protein